MFAIDKINNGDRLFPRRNISKASGYVYMRCQLNRCFNAVCQHNGQLVRSALYSSDETTQRFWDAFCAAAKVLRGGEAERMAA